MVNIGYNFSICQSGILVYIIIFMILILLLKVNIKVLYTFSQTVLTPIFILLMFTIIHFYKESSICYNICFYILIYNAIASFIVVVYLKNPLNYQKVENLLGKSFLDKNMTNSTPLGKAGVAIAAATASLASYTLSELVREGQKQDQRIENTKVLVGVSERAENNGDRDSFHYALRAAVDNTTRSEQTSRTTTMPDGLKVEKQRQPQYNPSSNKK